MKGFKIKDIDVSGLELRLLVLDLNDDETIEKYLSLFEACFGKRNKIDKRLFNWLHNGGSGYKNLNFALVENSTGQMVAAYGLLPGDVYVNGSIHKYALCTNVMTHPNYGGKGLFVAIGKEALEYVKNLGFALCCGMPNDQAIKGHLKVGWEIENEIAFYQNLLGKELPNIVDDGIKPDYPERFTDSELSGFLNDKYDFYFLRTASWLTWRKSRPYSKYINFGIEDSVDRGYMVVKQYVEENGGVKKMHIVDFAYNRISCFSRLIDHSCRLASQGGFDVLNIWHYGFNKAESDLLKSKEFSLSEMTNPVIIHKLGREHDLPPANWHITLFDNDVY